MHVLFSAYEAAPFYQKGGLGDVAGSLPLALGAIGVSVDLVLPHYNFLKLPQRHNKVGSIDCIFLDTTRTVDVYKSKIGKNVNLITLSHKEFAETQIGDVRSMQFMFFSKALASLTLNKLPFIEKADIVHVNDWHTAIASYYLKRFGNNETKSILTIHNILYFEGVDVPKVAAEFPREYLKKSYINPLYEGIEYSDIVTTVSPTYAKELMNTRKGMRYKSLLSKKGVIGIVNGIDYKDWNPQTDKFIIQHFSTSNFSQNKTVNKIALQRQLKLPVNKESILVSFVGRLEIKQKGIDLIYKVISQIMKEFNNVEFVILGTGSKKGTEFASDLVKKNPKRTVFINKFASQLSHRIYASSDIMLIPSKFEPCGLVQMIAMRYGALPLVRKTGGLADTVKDGQNGFVFEDYSPTEMSRTLRLALKLFMNNPETISKMRLNALNSDFSWEKSARDYLKLYLKLVK